MKKTPKILIALSLLGLLVGCNQPSPAGPSGGGETEETYLINVAYIKNQVSDERATEIKNGFIATLPEETDPKKINFFVTTNTGVASYVDEILFYNEDHPKNPVTVILGMNGLSNAGDSRETFESIYTSDGKNYTYGTSATLENRTNRKFFYMIDKAEDNYVLALQDYLQNNWTESEGSGDETNTGVLNVAYYQRYVSNEKSDEIKTEFMSYLESKKTTYDTILFMGFADGSAAVADFMSDVGTYNDDKAEAADKIDVLLGLRADTGNAVSAKGYVRDGSNEYTYADKTTSNRYFWRLDATANLAMVTLFKDFLDEQYTVHNEATAVVLSKTAAEVKVGESVDVTASLDVATEGATFEAVADKDYATVTVNGADINIALSEAAVVGETVVVTVTSGELTPATLTITVVAKDTVIVEETYFTIAYYTRYVSGDSQERITQEFKDFLKIKEDADIDNVVTVAYGNYGTSSVSVADLASKITEYNNAHDYDVDAILGCNGDSGTALADAGYKKNSETNYTYGSDTSRKLWVRNTDETILGNVLLEEFLNENYTPKATKVQLNKTAAEVKVGESVDVTASLDVATEGATFEAVADKDYATVTVNGADINIALSEAAVVGETVVVTVTSGELTPATLTITVVAKDTEEKVFLVVAFYNRYVDDAVEKEIETGFKLYADELQLKYDSITFVSLGASSGTTVAAFASAVTGYNGTEGNNTINVLLGCNGDSGTALADAGYKKNSETSYTYGTDNNRKIWVQKNYDATVDYMVTALIDYIVANYSIS